MMSKHHLWAAVSRYRAMERAMRRQRLVDLRLRSMMDDAMTMPNQITETALLNMVNFGQGSVITCYEESGRISQKAIDSLHSTYKAKVN
jgi:hypothetical protein